MGKAKHKPPLKLEFGEPKRTRRDYRWREVAAQLRKRPGEWAVVARDLPASVPSAVSGGRVSTVHPDRGFEVTSSGTSRPVDGPRRVAEMWMRYVPELDQSRAKQNGVNA